MASNPEGTPAAKRVLLVLDHVPLQELAKLTLNHGVFVTKAVKDAGEAGEVILEWQPDLVLLDMDLPGRRLLPRVEGSAGDRHQTAFIALTRRGDLKTKLRALDDGADDILTIPFAPEELLARAVAVLRRTFQEPPPVTPVIRVGDLEIDILNRVVRAGTSELHLTALEQSLLYLLAANAGRILTRDEILDALWGVDYVAESNVVDRQIRNLRARLQNDWRRPRFVETVPGQGYRFIPTFIR